MLSRPYGARMVLLRTPALTCWAISCRPYGTIMRSRPSLGRESGFDERPTNALGRPGGILPLLRQGDLPFLLRPIGRVVQHQPSFQPVVSILGACWSASAHDGSGEREPHAVDLPGGKAQVAAMERAASRKRKSAVCPGHSACRPAGRRSRSTGPAANRFRPALPFRPGNMHPRHRAAESFFLWR